MHCNEFIGETSVCVLAVRIDCCCCTCCCVPRTNLFNYIHAPWWTGMNFLMRAGLIFNVYWQGASKSLVGVADLFHGQEVPRHSSCHITYSLFTKLHSNWCLSLGQVVSISQENDVKETEDWELKTKPALYSAFVGLNLFLEILCFLHCCKINIQS